MCVIYLYLTLLVIWPLLCSFLPKQKQGSETIFRRWIHQRLGGRGFNWRSTTGADPSRRIHLVEGFLKWTKRVLHIRSKVDSVINLRPIGSDHQARGAAMIAASTYDRLIAGFLRRFSRLYTTYWTNSATWCKPKDTIPNMKSSWCPNRQRENHSQALSP